MKALARALVPCVALLFGHIAHSACAQFRSGTLAAERWSGHGAQFRSGKLAAERPAQVEARSLGSHRPRVLLVDIYGPNRFTGSGVRVMGMLMDMQEACDYEVHVVSNSVNQTELRSGWDAEVRDRYLKNVSLWGPADLKTRRFGQFATFAHIIIAGKLDQLNRGGAGVTSRIPLELANAGVSRSRVSVFWDDDPFERCLVRAHVPIRTTTGRNEFISEIKNRSHTSRVCKAVPGMIRKIARFAKHFYFLTPEDLSHVQGEMGELSIGDVSYRVWPLRLRSLGLLMPSQRFEMSGAGLQRRIPGSDVALAHPAGKKYLMMMGNNHAVNKLVIGFLFDSGSIARICRAVQELGSPVRILFLGAIAPYAHMLKNMLKRNSQGGPKTTACVEIRDGVVGEKELVEIYLPQTRAVLNPMFFDTRSGISIKSFEAIAAGFPVVTSAYGLHGLRHIGECQFPIVEQPASAKAFTSFVLDTVVDDFRYSAFAQRFLNMSRKCIYGQAALYSPAEICMVA